MGSVVGHDWRVRRRDQRPICTCGPFCSVAGVREPVPVAIMHEMSGTNLLRRHSQPWKCFDRIQQDAVAASASVTAGLGGARYPD